MAITRSRLFSSIARFKRSLGLFAMLCGAPLSLWAQEAQTWSGQLSCSAPVAGTGAAYTQPISLQLQYGRGWGLVETGQTLETFELSISPEGEAGFASEGFWRSDTARRWHIRARGLLTAEGMTLSGNMRAADGVSVVRERCQISLKPVTEGSPVAPAPVADPYPIEPAGDALPQSASTLPGGRGFAEWNKEAGQPWSYRRAPQGTGRVLRSRSASNVEQALVRESRTLVAQLKVKAIVLVDDGQVVSVVARPGIRASTLLPSASMSKTVTAVGVGRALCAGALDLNTRAESLLPALQGSTLGQASLRKLLLMSSGTAETETSHTHGITPEESSRYLVGAGTEALPELLASPRISRARTPQPPLPGWPFDYKSTDPYAAALMVQQATGVPFTQWLDRQVFDAMGAGDLAVLDTDRRGNFLATGGVRLSLSDWIRFAVHVQEERGQPGCFGDFLRAMGSRQISIPRIDGVNGYFDGYGYFTWTHSPSAPNVFWAAGHFGQRIGWSTQPDNRRIFLTFGQGSDADMHRIYPLARRWIHP
jgi:CubicO group peptidase (beta-lactamase class C family)